MMHSCTLLTIYYLISIVIKDYNTINKEIELDRFSLSKTVYTVLFKNSY